jgi:hypothetical protein
MAIKNIHDKFAGRAIFINSGIALVSLLFFIKSFTGNGELQGNALIDPVLAFGLSAIVALFGIAASTTSKSGFIIYRDGLPILVFAASLLASGNDRSWVWLLLALAIVANVLFIFAAGKYDSYDEDQDRIPIYFRWPF